GLSFPHADFDPHYIFSSEDELIRFVAKQQSPTTRMKTFFPIAGIPNISFMQPISVSVPNEPRKLCCQPIPVENMSSVHVFECPHASSEVKTDNNCLHTMSYIHDYKYRTSCSLSWQ